MFTHFITPRVHKFFIKSSGVHIVYTAFSKWRKQGVHCIYSYVNECTHDTETKRSVNVVYIICPLLRKETTRTPSVHCVYTMSKF